MTCPPAACVALTSRRCRRRHPVPLGVRQLVTFERRHAGVQRDRGDADAMANEVGDELGREGPGRARHLGAARLVGEDGLVGLDGEVALDVAVADRTAGASEPGDRGRRRRRRRRATTAVTRARDGAAGAAVPSLRRDVAGVGVEHERLCRPIGDRVSAARPSTARQAVRSRRGSRAPCRRRALASIAAGIVPDVLTTTRSPGSRNSGQVAERRVNRSVGAVRDEETHVLPCAPAQLGRLACDVAIVELEVKRQGRWQLHGRCGDGGGHHATSLAW